MEYKMFDYSNLTLNKNQSTKLLSEVFDYVVQKFLNNTCELEEPRWWKLLISFIKKNTKVTLYEDKYDFSTVYNDEKKKKFLKRNHSRKEHIIDVKDVKNRKRCNDIINYILKGICEIVKKGGRELFLINYSGENDKKKFSLLIQELLVSMFKAYSYGRDIDLKEVVNSYLNKLQHKQEGRQDQDVINKKINDFIDNKDPSSLTLYQLFGRFTTIETAKEPTSRPSSSSTNPGRISAKKSTMQRNEKNNDMDMENKKTKKTNDMVMENMDMKNLFTRMKKLEQLVANAGLVAKLGQTSVMSNPVRTVSNKRTSSSSSVRKPLPTAAKKTSRLDESIQIPKKGEAQQKLRPYLDILKILDESPPNIVKILHSICSRKFPSNKAVVMRKTINENRLHEWFKIDPPFKGDPEETEKTNKLINEIRAIPMDSLPQLLETYQLKMKDVRPWMKHVVYKEKIKREYMKVYDIATNLPQQRPSTFEIFKKEVDDRYHQSPPYITKTQFEKFLEMIFYDNYQYTPIHS